MKEGYKWRLKEGKKEGKLNAKRKKVKLNWIKVRRRGEIAQGKVRRRKEREREEEGKKEGKINAMRKKRLRSTGER